MPPTNTAAWQTAAKVTPLEIKPAPYTSPLPNEITIRNHAVAINPVDRVLQERGEDLFAWIKYPTILGIDTAGEVVEVGSNVTRFKVGDRVLTGAEGITANNPAASAFQHYTVLLEDLACKIPDTLSYEQAAVLPLGLSTAACGLFPKDFLALEHPTLSPKSTGKALLIWGGATSVGSNAIQLAVAAGYEVMTTASAKNFEYVKNLGASQVFDYNSESIVDDLIDAFKGKTLAGAFDSIGINGAFQACAAVLLKSQGRKFIAACMHLPKDMPDGIEAKFIFGSLKDKDESKVIFQDFLPKALAEGKYIAAPDPVIAGKGLESIQTAFELQKKGVSAKKIVVSL